MAGSDRVHLADIGGIRIAYQEFGSPSDPPLLLVMGLGSQMVFWDEEFCAMLAGRGYRVIRFDNRDTGLSSHLPGTAYTLDDMAADTAGLIEALGLPSAHLTGVSLGGMIAQTAAVRYPGRVLSLCSISSTTGNPGVGRPRPGVFRSRLSGTPTTREEAMDRAEATLALYAGLSYPDDPDPGRWRWLAGQAWDRCSDSSGLARHWAAIKASGDRTEALRELRIPTVVIHGDEDPAIDVSGGVATAEAVPGAELVIVPGMGHQLPRGAWKTMIDAIVTTARRGRDQVN
jgi:pimeloyl-ACP methyl ester carboxylesterase